MKLALDKNNPEAFIEKLTAVTRNQKILFMCLGTDKITGDSLGCRVGSSLESLGYKVIGTLNEPLHASNIVTRVKQINKKDFDLLIAIDSSLGSAENVGNVYLLDQPLRPGAAVMKSLPKIGDYSMIGVVGASSFWEGYNTLRDIQKSFILEIVDSIVYVIKEAVRIP